MVYVKGEVLVGNPSRDCWKEVWNQDLENWPRLEGMHRFQNPLHANNNVKFKNKWIYIKFNI